jgi:RNA polymerase sigma-70 factor, ECF subfamily
MRVLIAPGLVGWRALPTTRRSPTLVASMPPDDDGGDDFAALAARHRAQLMSVALRLSGNAEIAKDLVQEALLRAFRGFDRFRAGSDAGAWLVRIVTRLYYDYLKHQRVVRKAEPDLIGPEIADDDSQLATIADAALYAAVAALEPELREVVELCYLQQLRYREAAERLKVPVGTVGTRLKRARERLLELLTTPRPEPNP